MESFKKFLNKKARTPEEIAKKHKVPLDHIENQLKLGIRTEKEHTTHEEIARQIALNHLLEDPNYYTKLKSMEAKKK